MAPTENWLKTQQAVESLGRNAGGAGRNILAFLNMQSESALADKKLTNDVSQFNAKHKLEERKLDLTTKATGAVIAGQEVETKAKELALSQEIDSIPETENWMRTYAPGGGRSILDAPYTGNYQADQKILKVKQGAGVVEANTSDGRETTSFMDTYSKLDGRAKAALREKGYKPGQLPTTQHYTIAGAEENRFVLEKQKRDIETAGAKSDQMTERQLTVNAASDAAKMERELVKSQTKYDTYYKKAQDGGLGKRELSAAKMAFDAAKSIGDVPAMNRVSDQLFSGKWDAPLNTEDALKRSAAETEMKQLQGLKTEHEKKIYQEGDERTGLFNRSSRKGKIEGIDKRMGELQKILSQFGGGGGGSAPAAKTKEEEEEEKKRKPGALGKDGRPVRTWDSTNSVTLPK